MDQAVAVPPVVAPFRRVPAGELGAHWDSIAQKINETCAKWATPWGAADVLARLTDGRAALYLRDEGFIVLEQCVEALSGHKYLNAWFAWFKPLSGKPIRAQAVAWLDAMKVAHDCQWIEFSSPRAGWAILESYFAPHMTVWRRA